MSTNLDTEEACFGELRSRVHAVHHDSWAHHELWRTMREAYKRYPKRYNTEWRYYLESALTKGSNVLDLGLTHLELEEAIKLAPFAKFSCSYYMEDFVEPEYARRVFHDPLMRHVASFGTRGGVISTECTSILASSPHLRGLSTLTLSGDHRYAMGDEGARAIASSKAWETLRRLCLYDCGLSALGIESLCQAPFTPYLRDLTLMGELGDRGIRAITQCAALCNLESLWLYNTSLHRESLHHLARSPYLWSLRDLALHGCDLRSQDLLDLVSSPNMTTLQSLSLNDNQFAQSGLQCFTLASSFRKLERLSLSDNALQDHMLEVFGQHQKLPQLKQLDLCHNEIGPTGIKHLCHASFTPSLEALDLSSNHILPEGVAVLASSDAFSSLKTLNLGLNDIGDDALLLLLRAPWIQQIECLRLYSTGLSARGAKSLANMASRLTSLRSIDLSEEEIGPEGVMALRAQPLFAESNNILHLHI